MFLGEYRHQTDEKFRLRLPARLKKQVGSDYIITKGSNNCLFIFTKSMFEEHFFDKIKQVSLFDLEAQRPLRVILSSAFEVEEDAQGRFLLPKALREFAKIKKDVVFVGAGTHIELWDSEVLEVYFKDLPEFDKLIGGLKNYGV